MNPLRLPASDRFAVSTGYLNNAWRHPVSRTAATALREYSEGLSTITGSALCNAALRERVRSQFALLIGATPTEIAITPSTVFAENLLLSSLGLPNKTKSIVTDTLHFSGSIYMYEALRQQGFPVEIIRAHGSESLIDQYREAIVPGTRLVALSLVTATTGVVRDVAAIADLAHERGALVYVDLIQAAGTMPIDVRALGVDFAACSSFKWLMGDMGTAFLYVRDTILEQLERPVFGLEQCTSYRFSGYPYDSRNEAPSCTFERDLSARSLFEVQTFAVAPLILLEASLDLIARADPARIQAHREPLLERIHNGLRTIGLHPLTPKESTSAILAFRHDVSPGGLDKALQRAGVRVSVFQNFLRVSPSFYNTADDIEMLIDALRSGLRSATYGAPPSSSRHPQPTSAS